MRVEIRPAFEEAVMASPLSLRKAAAKMLTLLQSLDLVQLWNHPGLNFEKLHGLIEPTTQEQMYSLRVNGSALACLLKGPTIILVRLHAQHDKAYRK